MKLILSPAKVEQVRQAVLEQICSRGLLPGDRLVEARLARDAGVSQATINSALQDPPNQGVVTKVLNRSTNVSRYSLREIDNLFSARLVLEPAAARAARLSLDPSGTAKLHHQLNAMLEAARAGELPRFCLADYSFHQQMYELTKNPFLTRPREVIHRLRQGPDSAEQTARERIPGWRLRSVRALETFDAVAAGAVLPATSTHAGASHAG